MVRDSGSIVCSLGTDAASTNFGDIPRLSHSFFSSSRGIHPTVGRFTGIKSGPLRLRLVQRALSGTGGFQHSLPSDCCHRLALAHRSQLSGLARQGLKPPPVGKGPEPGLPPI